MNEEDRIRLAYSRRVDDEAIYSLFDSGQLFISQGLERELIKVLRQHGLPPLHHKKVLDIGCGIGWPLRKLVSLGAGPENLCGIDLRPGIVEEAKKISPNMDFRCGNAESLPYEDGSFDLVLQFTMFTSILDYGMKVNVAKEMLRVVKPHGIILWYDYFVSKPGNPDVKGIGKKEIIGLFPNCLLDFNRVILAPPIARAVAPYSFLVCYLLVKVPWLRTHYLAVIRKRH
jgi:ubiquinone/menaquinone biosynthesis C-methylase UbiE